MTPAPPVPEPVPPTTHPAAHYDVVVVGARPAGAATALLLARQGLDVLVVDRSAFGVDVLSTHALMKGAVLQLHRWGLLDQIVAAGTPPVRRTVIHYGDESLEIPMKAAGGIDALYAPRRTVLDPVLASAAAAAGADVRFRTTVSSLVRDEHGRVAGIAGRDATGEAFTVRADLVVGADGLRSRVARDVGAPVTLAAAHTGAVVYAYFEAAGPDGYEWYYREGIAAGLIPTNGGVLAWGATTPQRFRREVRPDPAAGFTRLLADGAPEVLAAVEGTARTSRFHTHPGTPGFLRTPVGPGWALVGDASHFKDPISAHGITDALRDAELLARAAGPALSAGRRERAHGLDAALDDYHAARDRLSVPMHHVVDAVASYRWSLPEVRDHLIALSRCMQVEVEAIEAFDVPGGVAPLEPAA